MLISLLSTPWAQTKFSALQRKMHREEWVVISRSRTWEQQLFLCDRNLEAGVRGGSWGAWGGERLAVREGAWARLWGLQGAEAWTRHSLVGLKRNWCSWLRWPWGWRGCLEQQVASDCEGSGQWTFNLEDKVQGGEERSHEGWGCLRMGWGCATCINGSPRRVHTPRRGQLCFTLYCAVLLFTLPLMHLCSPPLMKSLFRIPLQF